MATAFREEEKQNIQDTLLAEAQRCAVTLGVRKTTVDQLAAGAGISKGAFYKFYGSKELLFLEVLEKMHAELYGAAREVLQTRSDLSESERTAEAILTICRKMEESSMISFLENDLPFLLRKIPQEILQKYYHSDDTHIQNLLGASGLHLSVSLPAASAAVRAILTVLSHRKELDGEFPQALSLLVNGLCDQIFAKSEDGY